MKPFDIERAYTLLREQFKTSDAPIVAFMKLKNTTPFRSLIGTILSARTKDAVTIEVIKELFAVADTPQEMAALSVDEIAALIKRVGFYKTKAKALKTTSQMILDDFGGEVPQTLDELLTLAGVGRKTANIVLAEAFDTDAISVDIHVHRISNRWGYVQTDKPEETEMALREKLPKEYWKEYNPTLVAHGQTICAPVSPFCSRCILADMCPRIGVTKSR